MDGTRKGSVQAKKTPPRFAVSDIPQSLHSSSFNVYREYTWRIRSQFCNFNRSLAHYFGIQKIPLTQLMNIALNLSLK